MDDIKQAGSDHYKTGDVEPIDLYRAGDMLRDYCVTGIIKYAFRNRKGLHRPVSIRDMEKIQHLAEIMKRDTDTAGPPSAK